MSVITQYGNYVKFLRGTPNAYSQLNPKDDDTLYFVAEKDADTGVLYLGEKLISGSLNGSTTLQDLNDTLISAGIEAGSLLYYDGANWIDKSLADILEIIVGPMVGATASKDGKSGLVPIPKAGVQDLYLKGDGTWADPTTEVKQTINLVVGQVGTLIGNDVDKSARSIAQEEVAKVVNGAPEALDTLKEIADYLQEHPTESGVAQRLIDLENAIYTPTTGLSDRVQIVQAAVNDLNNELEALKLADQEHDQQIANIQLALNALKWQKMVIV